MRDAYHCPYCDQRSTRRWNLDVHIKRRHGGYLLGRSSDRYMTNSPPLYSQSVHLGNATVADSVGDTFQPIYVPQQARLVTLQYPINPPVDVSRTFANPMNRPMPAADGSLSWGAVQKIQELKALMNKYSYYHTNPDDIIRLAI